MSKTVFDFNKQLGVGNQGEKDFVRLYPSLKPKKSDDFAYDFVIEDGSTVELKTDSYPMAKTANFFMEEISDIATGKLGGPFRAHKDNVKYFVYYYVSDRTFFWFETSKLYPLLRQLVDSKRYKPKVIWNKGWTSTGYAVPRVDLKSVLLREEKIALDTK